MSGFDKQNIARLETLFKNRYIIGHNGLIVTDKLTGYKVIVMRIVNQDEGLVTDHVYFYKVVNGVYCCREHYLVNVTDEVYVVSNWMTV